MGRVEEGWHFLAGPQAASPAPGRLDSADRQAPDAISGGAPLREQFPFFPQTVGNRGGGGCRRQEQEPQPHEGDRSRTGWHTRLEGDGERHLPTP